MLAVQDFCHAAQKGEEAAADFIRRLQRCFGVAYGMISLDRRLEGRNCMGNSKEVSRWR